MVRVLFLSKINGEGIIFVKNIMECHYFYKNIMEVSLFLQKY